MWCKISKGPQSFPSLCMAGTSVLCTYSITWEGFCHQMILICPWSLKIFSKLIINGCRFQGYWYGRVPTLVFQVSFTCRWCSQLFCLDCRYGYSPCASSKCLSVYIIVIHAISWSGQRVIDRLVDGYIHKLARPFRRVP